MVNDGKTYDSSLGLRSPSPTPPGGGANRRPESKPDEEEAWAQLAAQYLRSLPQQLDRIRTTVEIKDLRPKDYSTIKKQAHRIKGTSGTYRLDTISEGIAQLERLADSQNPDAIVTTINRVMRLVEKETERLNSRLISSNSSTERNANG